MQRLDCPDADLAHVIYLPDNYDPETALPLIVFMHGRGERGHDLVLLRKWGVPKFLDENNQLEAIVFAPQCPISHENWTPMIDAVIAKIDALQAEYVISQTHITGFSMGGHGTQYISVHHPERFTTVAPVATFMYSDFDVTEKACVLKNKRIWIFHSEADFVPVAHSDKVVEKLRDCEATDLKYTRYTEANHTQTADLAYLNEEFYQWMLNS